VFRWQYEISFLYASNENLRSINEATGVTSIARRTLNSPRETKNEGNHITVDEREIIKRYSRKSKVFHQLGGEG
jgi:hypothetical protein